MLEYILQRVIYAATHSQFTVELLDAMFINPITNSRQVQKNSRIEKSVTVHTLLTKLVNANLISIIRHGIGGRSTIYRFDKLLNLADE